MKELKTLKALLALKESGQFAGEIILDNDEILAVQGDDVVARLDRDNDLMIQVFKLLGFKKVECA